MGVSCCTLMNWVSVSRSGERCCYFRGLEKIAAIFQPLFRSCHYFQDVKRTNLHFFRWYIFLLQAQLSIPNRDFTESISGEGEGMKDFCSFVERGKGDPVLIKFCYVHRTYVMFVGKLIRFIWTLACRFLIHYSVFSFSEVNRQTYEEWSLLLLC